MRYYISEGQYAGQRLQVGHPLWPKTKAETPYKNQPPRAKFPELYRSLGLRPSVTTFTSLVDPFPVKGWIMSLIKRCPNGENVHDWVAAESVRQRDFGTVCHGAPEAYLRHGAYPSDPQLYNALSAVLPYFSDDAETEVQFCNDRYGGTVDILEWENGHRVVKDFKFIEKSRKCYPSEIAQTVKYMDHFNADIGVVLPVWTKKWTVTPHIIERGSREYYAGQKAGNLALDLFNETIRLKESMK